MILRCTGFFIPKKRASQGPTVHAKWPVYSSFTSFFLALSFYHSSNGKIISITNVNKFPHLQMHIFAISSFAIIEEMFSAETFFCHMEEMGSRLHFLSYERKLELVEIGIQWSEKLFHRKKRQKKEMSSSFHTTLLRIFKRSCYVVYLCIKRGLSLHFWGHL